MKIELDEAPTFDFSPGLIKKITRPRAIRILELIQEAREVIINTHPEPDTLRLTYSSEWFTMLVEAQPDVIDPKGTIRFLQKIDALFVELGLDEGADVPADLPPGDGEAQGESNIPPANPNDPDGF